MLIGSYAQNLTMTFDYLLKKKYNINLESLYKRSA